MKMGKNIKIANFELNFAAHQGVAPTSHTYHQIHINESFPTHPACAQFKQQPVSYGMSTPLFWLGRNFKVEAWTSSSDSPGFLILEQKVHAAPPDAGLP